MLGLKVDERLEFFQVFPDYDTFAEWYKSTDLSDDDNDVPSKKTFALIFNEYACNHICMYEYSFKLHFANELYTYYKEFEATTEEIDKLMALEDEEIAKNQFHITNVAQIPEEGHSTDTETVDFISTQQKDFNQMGELETRRTQLANKRAYTVKAFLKRFKHLFIKVISPYYTHLYNAEE